ncbi:HAD family phosphatase [Eubacterium sp. 1001713B170207_170306_E7]|uniref:HAD family hydrolase n=1 Tax=Eubacterium sp. 1001713B170207_170306_E7 TaxID=2787097 RepID=UPI0018992BB2|nr:HAD family phosphatase [Eubacterium sp. 1001713B170207_170306_E7]
MIEAVIFDMDGVIIDSETDYQQIELDMYAEMGLDMSEEDAVKSMGRVTVDWWRELKERFGFAQSAEELAEYENKLYLDFLFSDEQQKTMMEGVDVFLKTLKDKGYRLAIASSSTVPAINRVLELFGLEQVFDVRVSGDHVAIGKPAPDIFLRAAELLNVEPEKCMVIEDSGSGILAAKRAGMKCTAYLSAPDGQVDYRLADYQVAHFDRFFETVTVMD